MEKKHASTVFLFGFCFVGFFVDFFVGFDYFTFDFFLVFVKIKESKSRIIVICTISKYDCR